MIPGPVEVSPAVREALRSPSAGSSGPGRRRGVRRIARDDAPRLARGAVVAAVRGRRLGNDGDGDGGRESHRAGGRGRRRQHGLLLRSHGHDAAARGGRSRRSHRGARRGSERQPRRRGVRGLRARRTEASRRCSRLTSIPRPAHAAIRARWRRSRASAGRFRSSTACARPRRSGSRWRPGAPTFI